MKDEDWVDAIEKRKRELNESRSMIPCFKTMLNLIRLRLGLRKCGACGGY